MSPIQVRITAGVAQTANRPEDTKEDRIAQPTGINPHNINPNVPALTRWQGYPFTRKDTAAVVGTESKISLASIPIAYNGRPIDMATVTVSPKYQIVIPKEVRDRLVMAPGDKVEVIQLEGRIELMPVRSARSLKGFLKGRKNTFQRENDRCLR
jgi:AbrB family looped-hinge helix DNA binding protein